MNLLKGTNNIHFKLLALFFFTIAIFHFSLSIYEGTLIAFLWFCVTVLILFAIGLYYKNILILSSVVTSSFLIELLWTIDIISFSLTGKLIVGIATYLYYIPSIRYILTFYHLFLFVIPIYIIFMLKDFHKYSWIFSSIHLFAVSILTLALTKFNINCVRDVCELGIFNFIYAIKPTILPFFIFSWLALTLIVFIPTHLLFYFIIRKIKNN